MNISVVIPAYNSEATIASVAIRVDKVLSGICAEYEILIVNDCSVDRTWDKIAQLAMESSKVRGFNLMRNYGQHNALLCGVQQARYDLIVTLDDDLQNPPEEIPKMLRELQKGYDVVYGKPESLHHGLLRDTASRITKIALKQSLKIQSATDISAFRIFRTQLREGFAHYQGAFVSLDVLLSWGTTRFSSVTVEHAAREVGTSNYNLWKLINHALNMLTGFTGLPLRLASFSGFVCVLFGLFVLVYVVGRVLLQGSPVPGFPFIASLICIFSGVQLFSLGIIGEYLSRVHFGVMGKPHYLIRDSTLDSSMVEMAHTDFDVAGKDGGQ